MVSLEMIWKSSPHTQPLTLPIRNSHYGSFFTAQIPLKIWRMSCCIRSRWMLNPGRLWLHFRLIGINCSLGQAMSTYYISRIFRNLILQGKIGRNMLAGVILLLICGQMFCWSASNLFMVILMIRGCRRLLPPAPQTVNLSLSTA